MSNPPFRSPLQNEEEDFSFPFQPPNNDDDPINFPPPLIQDQNPNLPTNTSSQPMSDYQDLSMFLGDDDYEEDYTLIGQYNPNLEDSINWPIISPIEHVGLDQVQQAAAQGPSLAHHEMQYYHPASTSTTDNDQASAATATAAAAAGGVGEGSSSKKLDHNAKEKVRRMKLNETYLTLRSLLPDCRRAKKKWSAPYIIDRTLDYIPQLQAEIEKLKLEKNNMVSVLGKKHQIVADRDDQNDANTVNKTLTVSINEVKNGEVIVQICEHNNKVGILSTLIEKIQGEGMNVLGASSQRVCEDRSCFHLHVLMGEKPIEADYVAELYKKIISWLS